MITTLLFLFLNLSSLHPIHLTVTNIEYNIDSKKINISFRIFANDLEQILNSNNNTILNIGKKNELKRTNEYINEYILNHFSLKIDNYEIKSRKYTLKKRELKDLTLWLNYSVDFSQKITKIEIFNSLLTDLYKDQKNLLIFTYKNKQTPLQFNSKQQYKTIKF